MLDDVQDEILTAEERQAMKTRLRLFMDAHPARAPLSVRLRSRMREAFSTNLARVQFAYAYRAVAVGLAAAVFAGVGTSYAAENALPGDPLYGVKINVNEKIRSALATTPSARADWNMQVATRRLEEAEALAAQGKLTPLTASALQSQVSQAASQFDSSVAAIADAESGTSTAVSVRSDMRATLDGHASVIAQISDAVPGSRGALEPLLSNVRAQAEEIAAAHASPGLNRISIPPAEHVQVPISSTSVAYSAVATGTASSSTSGEENAAAPASGDGVMPPVPDESQQEAPQVIAPQVPRDAQETYDSRKAEVESSARNWLKETVGVMLPAQSSIEAPAATGAANPPIIRLRTRR